MKLRTCADFFHYLENKKKHMMGWNEITGVKIHDYTDFEDAASGESLAEGTIVHFWRGDPSLIKQTVKKGYQVVNSEACRNLDRLFFCS